MHVPPGLVEWLTLGVICVGLIITLVRKYGNLETTVNDVKNEVKDKEHGLSAINTRMSDFKLHCAGVSTTLTLEVAALKKNTADNEKALAEVHRRIDKIKNEKT